MLSKRFEQFIADFPGIERIDALRHGETDIPKNRADYFGDNRRLVIELKSLESDPEYKVADILKEHRSRPEFPVFFNGWEISKVIRHLPDGEEIQKKIDLAVTSPVRSLFRKANGQIADTKELYNLPDSQGLLVILNAGSEILLPEMIFHAIAGIAYNVTEGGTYMYQEIDAALLISDIHVKDVEGISAHPIILMKVKKDVPFVHEQFVSALNAGWAEFNGAKLIK